MRRRRLALMLSPVRCVLTQRDRINTASPRRMPLAGLVPAPMPAPKKSPQPNGGSAHPTPSSTPGYVKSKRAGEVPAPSRPPSGAAPSSRPQIVGVGRGGALMSRSETGLRPTQSLPAL
jgi:hypothetical protein